MIDLLDSIIKQALIDANNMALIEEAYSTADFLEKCSKFLRYSSKNQPVILIKDELRALKSYLELRKFHETIELQIEVQSQTAEIEHMSLIKTIAGNLKIGQSNSNIENPTHLKITEKFENRCLIIEITKPGSLNEVEANLSVHQVCFK